MFYPFTQMRRLSEKLGNHVQGDTVQSVIVGFEPSGMAQGPSLNMTLCWWANPS